jgi:hypothetical protein
VKQYRKFALLTAGDVITGLIILVFAFLVSAADFNRQKPGEICVITGPDFLKKIEFKKMKKKEIIRVKGRIGPVDIEVSGLGAAFVSSLCPGRQCMKMGHARHGGDFVLCAPNNVAAVIQGEGPDNVHGITY